MTKIYFIVDNDPLFQPYIIEDSFRRFGGTYKIVGATIAMGDGRKISDAKRKTEQLNLYGRKGLFLLKILDSYYRQMDLKNAVIVGVSAGVKSAFAKNGITPYCALDINEKQHLEHVRSCEPDVIISCTHQIFKRELLGIAKIACINKHTGDLPGYAGVLSVFWAMLNDEKIIYQTVHIMEERLDAGAILAKEGYTVSAEDTMYGIYAVQFRNAARLLKDAVDRLLGNEKSEMDMSKRGYYSYPGKEACKAFRKKRKLFTVRELMTRWAKVDSKIVEV